MGEHGMVGHWVTVSHNVPRNKLSNTILLGINRREKKNWSEYIFQNTAI